MDWEELLQQYRQRKEKIFEGGGKERIKKIKDAGKLTARERIEYLLDPTVL